MGQLRECPFCGSRDVVFADDWYDDGGECMTVLCNNCRAMLRPEARPCDDGGEVYVEGDEPYDALAERIEQRWNTRNNTSGMAETVIVLAEGALAHLRSVINVVKDDGVFSDIEKLSEKIRVMRDQIAREKTSLDETPESGRPEQDGTFRTQDAVSNIAAHSEERSTQPQYGSVTTPVDAPVIPPISQLISRAGEDISSVRTAGTDFSSYETTPARETLQNCVSSPSQSTTFDRQYSLDPIYIGGTQHSYFIPPSPDQLSSARDPSTCPF